MQIKTTNKGFTLLEILLVIALIGILAAIVLVAINPNKQIEAARSAKRRADINTIQKAIQQYSIDNNGQYPTGIETGAKAICRGGAPVGCIDLSSILAPTYLASIPEPDSNYYYVRRSNNSIEVSHPRDDIWNIGGTPSLDLKFASNKSLIDNVTGNNLVTFTRTSSGTYVGEDGLIKTAGVNEPRFDHNPVTGESLGLLVEESRSNQVNNSETFTGRVLRSSNLLTVSTTAPDGTNSVKKLSDNNSVARFRELDYTGGAVTGTGNFTFSIFCKKAEREIIGMGNYNSSPGNWIFFNLKTESFFVVSGYSSPTTYGYVKYPNNWYRIWYTVNITSNSGLRLDLVTGIDQSYTSYTGDGTSGVYVWGQQAEMGTFPSSYIPTTGSVITRTADTISVNGANFSNFFNTLEGTFFADYKSTSPTNARILNFGTGDTSTVISNEGVIGSGLNFSSIGNIAGATSNGVKVAATTSISESAGAFNGNTAVSTGATSYYTGSTSLNLLPDISGAPIKQNWLKRITYWPTRLPNSTLQTITQ